MQRDAAMRIDFLVLLAIALLSIGTGHEAIAQDAEQATDPYKVLPGDLLQIMVWKEEDLQMEVLVRPDAAFSFPLAGDISTDGLSVVDVMQALSMAGGLTPFASANDVKILRRQGTRQIALSFNYNDVLKGRDLSQNTVLQSGDIVVVP